MADETVDYPRAPLDPGDLAQSLLPYGKSRMLPPAAYTDPAVFAWEQRHFFGGGWVCAAGPGQLTQPGDQLAGPLGGAGSVLLARAQDGTVRAFANTCRHRGHELLPRGSAASRPAIVCPYHAWAYSLSGELRAAAGFKGTAGFDTGQWGLAELPAAQWHGLMFVDGSRRAGPLPGALDSLAGLVSPYEPGRLVVRGRHEYEVAANWKIINENYHECYHCPVIHPELCRVSPPKSGENYDTAGPWLGGWLDLRDGMTTMSLDGTGRGAPLRGLTGEGLRRVIYAGIFPNVLLSLHPDYVMTHRLVPLAANRTWVECSWAFAPESAAAEGFDPGYAVEFWDITNQQDWRACESVQRGLSSPYAAAGPLSADEDAVYRFVTLIARGYLGQSAWRPTSPVAGASPAP